MFRDRMDATPSRRPAGRGSVVAATAAAAAVAVCFGAAPAALAHGGPTPPAPTPGSFLLDWSFDPIVQIPLLAGVAWWIWAVRRVDAAHPANPVPRGRTVAFLLAILAVEIALQSGIERYDTTLFSIHMVQHMLLVLVAAPLFALSAPITLVLRVSSPETRRDIVLPILHSRVVRFIGHPVVAWIAFTAVQWITHVSPLFDAALESEPLHFLEHALFLGSALLFWWPVVGADPSPYRMSYPARLLYLGLQMPQNTLLAMTIYAAAEPLYPHYVTTIRPWGPSPLLDQQAAGAIMWVWGDLTFLVAMLLVLAAWWRTEERRAERGDRAVEAEVAAIREREARLAQRLSGERSAVSPLAGSAPRGRPGSDPGRRSRR
jgi:putative copper resistance protein D